MEAPSAEELAHALMVAEDAYASVVKTIPADFLGYSSFLRAVRGLDNSSSPGWPYMKRAPTIGRYLGFDGIWYDTMQLESLWHDVRCLIDGGDENIFCTVFVKSEPHKPEKVQEGRWRLIVAQPLHVQVLWHMLFDLTNDAEIENAYRLPSQQGLIMPRGGWQYYVSSWKSRGYDVGLDKRAWDWTVPGWLIKLELEFRTRLLRGDQLPQWRHLADQMYEKAFHHPILVLSDGRCFRQLYYGIMKSGCVNTISSNSHMQILVHVLATRRAGVNVFPLPVACGDDTLQCQSQAVDLSVYAGLGSVVKSASAGLEFVGHEFLSTGPVPLYFEKHMFSASYVGSDRDDVVQYLDSMHRLYAHSPLYSVWSLLAEEVGVSCSMRSKQYYLNWYDTPES